ncbi:MAG TPA: Uma2 family endonuclease [Longimicrobium sp.]|nr:Uma2 family endonuclease [Longimicrobium sp.]
MATAAPTRYTPEEYFALERHAEFRSEYIDGRIIATSPGASRSHNLIVSALVRHLEEQLENGPCEVYTTSQRVKVSASGDYLFPDVAVSCDPQFEDRASDNLLNPVLIIEVLSDSTEGYDRRKKFDLYRRIESLREYVLVSQKEPCAERHVRRGFLAPQHGRRPGRLAPPHFRGARNPDGTDQLQGNDPDTPGPADRERRRIARAAPEAHSAGGSAAPKGSTTNSLAGVRVTV